MASLQGELFPRRVGHPCGRCELTTIPELVQRYVVGLLSPQEFKNELRRYKDSMARDAVRSLLPREWMSSFVFEPYGRVLESRGDVAFPGLVRGPAPPRAVVYVTPQRTAFEGLTRRAVGDENLARAASGGALLLMPMNVDASSPYREPSTSGTHWCLFFVDFGRSPVAYGIVDSLRGGDHRRNLKAFGALLSPALARSAMGSIAYRQVQDDPHSCGPLTLRAMIFMAASLSLPQKAPPQTDILKLRKAFMLGCTTRVP